MKNLLALLGLAIVVFAGLGYYHNWYKIDRSTSPTTGNQQISIEIDAKKVAAGVEEDVEAGADKVQDFLEKRKQAETEAKSKSSANDSERPHEESAPE
jgi:hypothetical protein